jgi:hypothetical protein
MRSIAVLLLLLLAAALPARPQPAADDAETLRLYEDSYREVGATAPAVLVLEMRDIIDLASRRGAGQAGGGANSQRIEAFEAALLRETRAQVCAATPAPPPSAPVLMAAVQVAASTQRLVLRLADLAEMGARLQRLIERVTPARWCALNSLDAVR